MKFKLIVLYQNQSVGKFYFVLGFLINFYFFRPPGFDCEIVKIWLKTPEVFDCAFFFADLRGLIAELCGLAKNLEVCVSTFFLSDLRGLIAEL